LNIAFRAARLKEPWDLSRWLYEAKAIPQLTSVADEELDGAKRLRNAIFETASRIGASCRIAGLSASSTSSQLCRYQRYVSIFEAGDLNISRITDRCRIVRGGAGRH
jgi:hypothetical protein